MRMLRSSGLHSLEEMPMFGGHGHILVRLEDMSVP